MTAKKQNLLLIIALIAIGVITHWRWFFDYSILSHGDWAYHFKESLAGYLTFPMAWSFGGIGSVNIVSTFHFLFFLQGALTNFGISYALMERLLFMFPATIILELGSYFFLKRVLQSSIGAFVGSLVFSFNVYVLLIEGSHLNIINCISIAPIVLLLYIEIFEKQKFVYSMLSALLLFAMSVYEFRIFYIFSFVLLFFSLLQFFLIEKIKNIKIFLKKSFLALAPILIVGLLNLYWVLGILKLNNLTSNEIFNRGLFGNNFMDILKSITLFHAFWTGAEPLIFIVQPIPYYFFLIPLIAFCGLVLNKKNVYIIFFGFVSLFGILLSKQAGEPFSGIYQWLYDNFPGFNAFREASKFYFLLSLGYSVLIGSFIASIWNRHFFSKIFTILITIFVSALFLWNSILLINGSINSLFVGREIPNDYNMFKKFVLEEKGVFRTLWMPRSSRWSVFTKEKTILSSIDIDVINKFFINENELLPEEKASLPLTLAYSKELIDVFNFRYIVVPVEDEENSDDFFIYYGGEENSDIRNWYISKLDNIDYLKKIDIGTDKLAVYENKNYKPYIFATNNLIGLKSLHNLDKKYEFLKNKLNENFNFYDLNKKNIYSKNVYISFENINVSNINEHQIDDLIIDKNKIIKVYVNTEKQNIKISYKDKNFLINRTLDNNLKVNGTISNISGEQENLFQSKTFGQDIFIDLGTRLINLKNNNNELDLGIVSNIFEIYSLDRKNAIKNASFEKGVWSKKVGDCNAYDNKPILAMELSDESVDGKTSLQLEATNHIACTGQDGISIEAGQDYIFGFDYQGQNAKHAGYYLSFNDEGKTIISERLPIVNEDWNHFQKKISIPATSTSMSLVVYSYSDDNQTNIITRYDNFQLKQLEKIATIDPKYKPEYEKISLANSDEYKIEYREEGVSYDNLIKNPSFEKGLWSNKVGDCNNYDDNGKLSMDDITAEKTDGEHALQLGATRHIACTGPDMMPVTEERTYLFSFDFQSPNGDSAGYYLGFNDPEQTVISERMPIEDEAWQSYTKQIKVPFGASAVSLVVYSYAGDGKKEIITRYDNFKLIELPDLEDRYFLVSEPEEKFVEPKAVEFEMINPTKKKVHIKGATTPFYLAMSESYHDQWQLQMNNSQINGFFDSWLPWVKPDRVADDKHFELNGFLNGWFVEPGELCQVRKVESYKVESNDLSGAATTSVTLPALTGTPPAGRGFEGGGDFNACTLNADGSYDMEMVIEFFPQRWFYLGLLISGTTFVGCIGYLVFYFIRRRKTKRETRAKEMLIK
jgi:hypothetical protein